MESSPPGGPQHRLRRVAVLAGWFLLLSVAFFSVPVSNPPGLRWNLWLYVPDLIDPPPRDAASGHSGWDNVPQRFDLLVVAAIILSGAWASGHLLLRALIPDAGDRRAGRMVLALGTGLSLLSLATLAAGVCGLLSRVVLGGAIGAALVLECGLRVASRFSRVRISRPRGDRSAAETLSDRWLGGLTVAACAPFVLAACLGSLLPSTDFDVNEYHFQGPKEFFQAGHIQFLEHNVYTSFPFGTEMLTLLAMVLRNDWYRGALAGKCVLMCFGPLTAIALFVAGRRWFGTVAGAAAAVLYLGTPWVYRISTIAYAEGGVCFYLFATLLAVMLAWELKFDASAATDPQTLRRLSARYALLAGFLAGSAMSCKYPALVSVVIPLGVCVIRAGWLSMQNDRTDPVPGAAKESPSHRVFKSAALTVAFFCGAAIAIGPWLLKNSVETGNPVYPLAYRIFGGRDWDDALNAKWRAGHSPPTYAVSSLFELARDVTYRSDWISPWLFGLAPASLCCVRTRRRAWWLAAYIAWLLGSCWLLTHRIDRFWVPMLPVVALLAGAGLAWWWQTLRGRWARAALVLTLGTLGVFHLEFMTGVGNWCGYNDYLRDLDEAGQVAARVTAPEIVYLNEYLPETARVLAVGDAEMFYARFPVVYNTVFDRSILELWLANPADGELRGRDEIRETLRAQGITHIYVNWLEILRYRSPGNYGYTKFVTPERFAELQSLGILAPAWKIPEATLDLDRLDPLWRPELEDWGAGLITGGPDGASLVTFQVFPVTP